NLPLVVAVEIVAHEESAAQQVLAHQSHLGVGQVPVAHLHSVEPGPVVLEAFVEIDRFLHAARMQPGQSPDGDREMAVAAWIVHGPEDAATAFAPIAPEPAEA